MENRPAKKVINFHTFVRFVSRFRSFVVDLPRRSRDDRGYETQRDLFSPMEWSSSWSLSWKTPPNRKDDQRATKKVVRGGNSVGAGQRAENCKRVWLNGLYEIIPRSEKPTQEAGKMTVGFQELSREKGGRDCEDWKYSGPGTRWVGNVLYWNKLLILFKLFMKYKFCLLTKNQIHIVRSTAWPWRS